MIVRDSYLVLHSFKSKVKDAEGPLLHHIHFWQGSDSTQDETGAVAIFAAQLDMQLGGSPVQFREAQGGESQEFLSLFPRAIFCEGELNKCGFKHVEKQKAPPQILHIRSERIDRCDVKQASLSVDSLNSGDAFLLSDYKNSVIYLWYGASANSREKQKAVATSAALRSGTATKLIVLDEGEVSGDDALSFFQLLGCSNPSNVAIKKA
jgi:gelsolin